MASAGECPKCGKVFSVGHRKHFESCQGTGAHLRKHREGEVVIEGMAELKAEEEELTAEERAAQVRDGSSVPV